MLPCFPSPFVLSVLLNDLPSNFLKDFPKDFLSDFPKDFSKQSLNLQFMLKEKAKRLALQVF